MTQLLRHTESESDREASIELDPARSADRPVPPELYGKFGEHLYSPRNVANVLEAQTLFNPTMGSWKFQDRAFDADGGRGAIHDPDEIDERIETYVENYDLPGAERLQEAYHDGTALWWFPHGEGVHTSPEVGTAGDRAQRIEVDGADAEGFAGIAQWCYLPLQRTRTFEGKMTVRARRDADVRIALHGPVGDDGDLGEPIAETTVTAGSEYETVEFTLEAPPSAAESPDALFGCSVTVDGDANVVLDRLLLYPDDHVGTADPELLELFAEAPLPVLRWPGGNFASGYHWQDAIGPIEDRPTKPNPAWDALETHLFGTDEFLQFCDAVDTEPVMCVNAGDGTPEEAAKWVEYCNGDPEETEMGALRAEHGHPEPYDVTYWEIGNELYGQWQITWTTPDGFAERFERFREAMTAVDDSIELMATGNRLTDWNEPTLSIMEDGEWLTDHVLVECHADPTTDPVELFNAHTGFAAQLGAEYREVAKACREAGIDPRLAITELQLFTRFDEPEDGDAPAEASMSAETLPTSQSITEAVFDASIINQCLRDGDVRMVTHSGVGNHGGGIRKQRGRVWADPCFYGRRLGLGLAGGTPIGVDVTSGTFSTETAFGSDTLQWFGELKPVTDEPIVDVVAVTDAAEYDLALLVVHRDAGTGEIDVEIDGGELLDGVESVDVETLTAPNMYVENTFDERDRITPTHDELAVADGTVSLSLSPYSVTRLSVE